MTLDQWSMVFLVSIVIWSLASYWSMFYNPSMFKFIVVIFTWLIHFGVTIWYGFATDQMGFKILPFFELMMVFFIYIATARAVQSDN